MSNVACYVDGFNLYHAIKNNRNCHKLKWIDMQALAQQFVKPPDSLAVARYFTAYAEWGLAGNPNRQARLQRHRTYTRALRGVGVEVHLGKFVTKDRFCPSCHETNKGHEEKQTDVNIAIQLLEDAIRNVYDKAIIVSGDSDLVPAILAVKRLFPNKGIIVVVPIGGRAYELRQAADVMLEMKRKHLANSQLADPVILPDGTPIPCPASWK